jgi:hypothetical protein
MSTVDSEPLPLAEIRLVMLVERVFLVSGVVKTVFPPNKKIEESFSFFTTNKKE